MRLQSPTHEHHVTRFIHSPRWQRYHWHPCAVHPGIMALRSKHRPGVLSAFTRVKMISTSHQTMRSTHFPITLEPHRSSESSLHRSQINLIYASVSNEPLTLLLDGLHSSQNASVEFAYVHVAPCPTSPETPTALCSTTMTFSVLVEPPPYLPSTLPIEEWLFSIIPTL